MLVIPVLGQEDTVEIPTWVKGVANFWVEDNIDDKEFAKALEFLIDSNIIQLGNTVIVSEPIVENDWEKLFNELQQENKKLHVDYTNQLNSIIQENESEFNELHKQHDIDYAEWKESYSISQEENGKLKIIISGLEKEIFDLKINASR